MEKYVALSPTHGIAPDATVSLPRGVRLSSLDDGSRPDFAVWGEFFSKEQIRWLSTVAPWLSYEFACSEQGDDEKFEATDILGRTALGLEIVSPTGTWGKERLVVLCHRKGAQPHPTSISRRPPLYSTQWGCRSRPIGSDPNLITPVVNGVYIAEERRVIRLQNSMALFMLGLQVNHPYISLLMWVAGLDSLLMAGEKKVFERRICNVLGEDSLFFPKDLLGDQPRYKVREVATDVWELRNEVAHGHEIPEKFRDSVQFEDVGGQNLAQGQSPYLRRDLLNECALFLLRACLLSVFTDPNKGVLKVEDKKQWRAILERSVR